MWLHVLACLLVAAPSIQELMINEDAFDDLSNGMFIDIARMEEQEDEVCTNKNKCNKKGGSCISKEETCSGDFYTGKNWCENSNTCQCCVNIDCHSRTNTACSVLNGTCIGINDVCNGRVANHKVFCKNPSTCKCCFPKEISECVVSAVTTEATTTHKTKAISTSTAAPTTTTRGSTTSPHLHWLTVGTDRFVKYNNTMNWTDARAVCRNDGLDLYEPKDILAVSKYLELNYFNGSGHNLFWLGGRGNTTHQVWFSGSVVPRTAPWYGDYYTYNGTNHCIALAAHWGLADKGTVLGAIDCTDTTHMRPLCG